MPAAVTRAALATPSPASSAVPRWPMIAESASRKSGSAMRARKAGTASRTISRRWLSGARAVACSCGCPRCLSASRRERPDRSGCAATKARTQSGSVRAWSRSAQPIALRLKKSGSSMLGSMTSARSVWSRRSRDADLADDRRSAHPERVRAGPVAHPQPLDRRVARAPCRARGVSRCRRRRPTRLRRGSGSPTTASRRCRPTRGRGGDARGRWRHTTAPGGWRRPRGRGSSPPTARVTPWRGRGRAAGGRGAALSCGDVSPRNGMADFM